MSGLRDGAGEGGGVWLGGTISRRPIIFFGAAAGLPIRSGAPQPV